MDLRGLKIDAADQRREIELLEALHAEFCAYVETLRALIAGGVEPAEFEAVRYALHCTFTSRSTLSPNGTKAKPA